jgi:hypothetical protein
MAPFVMDGTLTAVKVEFPPPDQPEGSPASGTVSYTPMSMTTVSKVRVRVTSTAFQDQRR